jgi:hypothetical protein
MRTETDPVQIMINVVDLKATRVGHDYYIYRKPAGREPFLWESVIGLEAARRRAQWLAERDADEYQVYDPRANDFVF